MDFGNNIKKDFTADHRRNYTIYNKSNIFNTDVVIQQNDKVLEFEPKYPKINESAYTRRLNEYYAQDKIERIKEEKSIQGTKGFFTKELKGNDSVIDKKNLTAKEMKLLEMNRNIFIQTKSNYEKTEARVEERPQEKNLKQNEEKNKNSKFKKIQENTSNIFHLEEKSKKNQANLEIKKKSTEEKEKNFNIISNEINQKIILKEKEKEQPNGSYIENLMKNQYDPKAKKLLNNISCLGNLHELELNKICLTDVNQEENMYANENRKKIEENAKDKFKDKNQTKLRKYIDQSSSLFENELYGENKREILKLQLVPKDNSTNNKNLSNEELKSTFAKKGIHAFDIMRKECEDVLHKKEHIKISIRKNDKNKNLMENIISEASKNGYDVQEIKEKNLNQKATDIVPWDSNWERVDIVKDLKKRLKNNEKDPELPKKKLPRDETWTYKKSQVNTSYKNKIMHDKKNNKK